MRVTVGIINYNHGRYLGGAIESALNQTRPADEILVVDDGSTDDSRAVIGRYPTVTAVFQENGGPGAATNTVGAITNGEILVLLDAR